ncbi:putative addiction module killer protein [Volucribacter psittacicida]|uniref:Putative addiction module killer protein n=1 Tax=Volucribacter psittacicida TaxID=203482 RepID=A0A4R1GBN5_9PAST|nr:type II toxin-antitoxin system RelE/ParE family toxin [Volucribacter psittacicida]TCK01682.1 putative addiction module killer protein [Volucribacter psittacicida]
MNKPKLYFRRTAGFIKWLKGLKDLKAKVAIINRIERAENSGNLGDVKSVGDGIFEMRIFISKGYRIYYTQQNGITYWLLCGGDKSTQQADIIKAKVIKKALQL